MKRYILWVMRFYSKLEEKETFFAERNLKINTFSELRNLLDEFESYKKSEVLFRGQPEAKYMLYSSLQRLWIVRNLDKHYKSYRELIENLIGNSREWNSGLISRYLKNAGWQETDMSVLSIMQHYGVPTPLLDFTYDINKSLFFAVQSVDFSPPAIEIENYFSIYFIFKNNTVLAVSGEIIREMIEYARESKNLNSELDATMQFDMTLIDNSDEAYRIQNNLNILNQEGAFIFNSSPDDPLEIHHYKYATQLNRISEESKKSFRTRPEIGGCININKKLADEIRSYLKEKEIDKYSMFPDLNQLRHDCLNMEWEKIRNRYESATKKASRNKQEADSGFFVGSEGLEPSTP